MAGVTIEFLGMPSTWDSWMVAGLALPIFSALTVSVLLGVEVLAALSHRAFMALSTTSAVGASAAAWAACAATSAMTRPQARSLNAGELKLAVAARMVLLSMNCETDSVALRGRASH